MHFEISERKVLLKVFDSISVLGTLYLIGKYFDFKYISFTSGNYQWGLTLVAYIVIFGLVFEMYHLQVASNRFQVTKSIMLTASTTVLVYLLTPVLTPSLPSNRIEIVVFYVAVLSSLFLWRIIYVQFLASHRFAKNAILVCEAEQLYELVLGLEAVNPHYKVKAFVNSTEFGGYVGDLLKIQRVELGDLQSYLAKHPVSEIVIASRNSDTITMGFYNQLVEKLQNGEVVREYSQVYEEMAQRLPVQYLARDFYLYFPFSQNNKNKLHLSFIRFFDIVFSIFGLVVSLLLLPIVLLGNLIANQGPLLYVQERVGKNGKVFKIYKYRTMVMNAEAEGATFAKVNDNRVTSWGKLMRKTRLDEFPQFINVLKGDMAIIGPRPERPVFVKDLVEIVPFYETRHTIRPGLTGWAQVNYSYGASIEDSLVKLQYDLYYIKHRNVFLDMDIMIKTVTTVLFYRGQ